MKKYTVILLYPDHLADHETYTAWVEAPNPEHAIGWAEIEGGKDTNYEVAPEDWYCLAVYEGHIKNLKP